MRKVIVITGAATGLGLSLAAAWVRAGHDVYGVSRTRRHWRSAREKIGKSDRFRLAQIDVTRERSAKAYLEHIWRQRRRIDVLINNAGYAGKPKRVDAETAMSFNRHLTHNLIGTFIMCKHAIPLLRRQRKAVVVNISSMAGKRAVPLLAAYSASKFGVLALSQCIAKENPGGGLKCITACPGGMNTAMRARVFGAGDAEKQQSADFVAQVILDVVNDKISVESGGDIVIRHGTITAIHPAPAP